MRSPSTSALLWGAGLVLVSGCVWAARIWDEHPQATGPDLRSLQQLAARVDQAPEAAPALGLPAGHGPALLPPPPRPVPVARPAVALRSAPPRIEPRPEGRRPAPPTLPPAAPAPPAPAQNDDAVKNLALLGVTFADGKDAAWLMDVSSRTREMAAVGESVLGFTVKEIEPDRVLLTRDGRDYSLRLGEKPNLVASASPVTLVSASDTGEDDSPFGFDPGGPGGRRGQGGPGGGGFGPGGFGNRPGGFGQFGGAGAFGGGRFGGGNFGGGNFGGGNFGGGGSNSSGGSTSSGASNSGGGGFAPPGGGFGGGNAGGFAAGGFGGGLGQTGTSSTSRTSSTASGTTSNPQTARRQGSRLTGDADPVEQPATIVNPQTQRRTGSSNQPAFGDTDTTVRGQTGSGRTGTGSTGSR